MVVRISRREIFPSGDAGHVPHDPPRHAADRGRVIGWQESGGPLLPGSGPAGAPLPRLLLARFWLVGRCVRGTPSVVAPIISGASCVPCCALLLVVPRLAAGLISQKGKVAAGAQDVDFCGILANGILQLVYDRRCSGIHRSTAAVSHEGFPAVVTHLGRVLPVAFRRCVLVGGCGLLSGCCFGEFGRGALALPQADILAAIAVLER